MCGVSRSRLSDHDCIMSDEQRIGLRDLVHIDIWISRLCDLIVLVKDWLGSVRLLW